MVKEMNEEQRIQSSLGCKRRSNERLFKKKKKGKILNSQELSLPGQMRVVGIRALYDSYGNWLVQNGLNGMDHVWLIW